MDESFGSMNSAFSLFSVLFFVIFILILGMIIFAIVRGTLRWNKNNNSPLLTVKAQVVAKREQVHGGTMGTPNSMGTPASTSYYVTFEFESRDRLELHVSPQEFGQLTQGDFGNLSFQGTRFVRFERLIR